MAEIVVGRPPCRQSTMVMISIWRAAYSTRSSAANPLDPYRSNIGTWNLTAAGATVRGLQHAHREQFGAVGVHVVPPVGEEFPVRIDAHTQWTILVHGILQSQTEIGPAHLNLFTADGLGHRHHDLSKSNNC